MKIELNNNIVEYRFLMLDCGNRREDPKTFPLIV